MWEIASAAGDPVAMCFLGQIHETGCVSADRRMALQWLRARQEGGWLHGGRRVDRPRKAIDTMGITKATALMVVLIAALTGLAGGSSGPHPAGWPS